LERLGHTDLHAEWKGEEDERRRRRRERHGRRAHGRRLGHTYFHQRRAHVHERRAHGFARKEGTRFCTRRGHTVGGNGLTSFSYLLSVHANCLMKCLIEVLDRMLDEMLSHPFKMHIDGLKKTKVFPNHHTIM
jgi:hypothetical protein